MSPSTFLNRYTFDKGLNLIQRNSGSATSRMIVAATSNRAINDQFYQGLDLTPSQKSQLNKSILSQNIFDGNGNQLTFCTSNRLTWDYRSMLQSTVTQLSCEEGIQTGVLTEYNLYAKTGNRNRKITEKTDAAGNIIEIQEALYLGNLEYRSTWTGSDLDYDGEAVRENNQVHSPKEAYVALRIRQGHKQVSEKRVYAFKDGIQVNEIAGFFSLDNNIDSCELQLNGWGKLESYYASKPYGETAVSYGKAKLHPYKYSGQEKDQSELYYYGYRSLLPQNMRWMSADPAGIEGSGLNWYAMVKGNPVSMRDAYGLAQEGDEKDSAFHEEMTANEPSASLVQTTPETSHQTSASTSPTDYAGLSMRKQKIGPVPISLNCGKYTAECAIGAMIQHQTGKKAHPQKIWQLLSNNAAYGWDPYDTIKKDFGREVLYPLPTSLGKRSWKEQVDSRGNLILAGQGIGAAHRWVGHYILVTAIDDQNGNYVAEYYDPLKGQELQRAPLDDLMVKVKAAAKGTSTKVAYSIESTIVPKFIQKAESMQIDLYTPPLYELAIDTVKSVLPDLSSISNAGLSIISSLTMPAIPPLSSSAPKDVDDLLENYSFAN